MDKFLSSFIADKSVFFNAMITMGLPSNFFQKYLRQTPDRVLFNLYMCRLSVI